MKEMIEAFRADVERTEAAHLRFITMRTAEARTLLDMLEQTSRAQRTNEGKCNSAAAPAAGQAGLATDELNGGMHASIFVKVWGDAGGGDAGRIALANYAYELGKRDSLAAPVAADTEQAIPWGYALVPLKCTPEMRAAWDRSPQSEDGDKEFFGAYNAMLDASPVPRAEWDLDDYAVQAFADAMRAKMAKSRAKGRGGWDDPEQCPTERLQSMLLDHIAKGDPVDVANFCMMLWSRDAPVAAPLATPADAGAGEPKLPEGWRPLVIAYNDDMATAEEVAYGPSFMMDRLSKWLEKFLAQEIASRKETVPLDEPGAMIFGETNSMDTKMNDIQYVASDSLIQRALALAMEICDAVPSRAHEAPEGDPLRSIGALINYQEATGMHGYALIRDALEFISRDADAPDAAGWLPTVNAVNALPEGVRQYVQQLEAEVNRRSSAGLVDEQRFKNVWNDALEEAALAVENGSFECEVGPGDRYYKLGIKDSATAIRALKSAPLATPADAGAGQIDERAEFEREMGQHYADLERTKDGAYYWSTTRTAWLAWQARAYLSTPGAQVTEVERTNFEAWGNEYFNYGFKPETRESGRTNAEYTHEETQMAWEGWQARAKLSGQSPAPVTAEPVGNIDTPEFRELLEKHRHCARWATEGVIDEICAHLATHSAPADRDAIRAEVMDEVEGEIWRVMHDDQVAPDREATHLLRFVRALKSMERAADAKGEKHG